MSKQNTKQKTKAIEKPKYQHQMAFDKDNYRWMIIGIGIILLGFILMVGKTDDLFNNGEVLRGGDVSFSTTIKITVAPLVILAGLLVEIYAILKKPAATDEPS